MTNACRTKPNNQRKPPARGHPSHEVVYNDGIKYQWTRKSCKYMCVCFSQPIFLEVPLLFGHDAVLQSWKWVGFPTRKAFVVQNPPVSFHDQKIVGNLGYNSLLSPPSVRHYLVMATHYPPTAKHGSAQPQKTSFSLERARFASMLVGRVHRPKTEQP